MVSSRTMSHALRVPAVVLMAGLLVTSNVAKANPEPTALYDARHAAMGGTAVATADNVAAVFQNPAGLSRIPNLSLSVVFSTLFVRYNVPFAGPGSEQDSPPIIAPLPFLGGAGRVSRRLVVGGALYITTGFGGKFTNIRRLDDYTPRTPCFNQPIGSDTVCSSDGSALGPTLQDVSNQTVTLFVAEAAASAGIRVTDNLHVGLSLRLPWAQQSTSSMQEILANTWRPVSQQVQGFGLPGVLLGVQWDVHPNWTLAFAYRSRTSINMSGTTELNLSVDQNPDGPAKIKSDTQWRTPHMIRFGIAGRFLQRRLLLTAEFRAQFHHQVNNEQRFDLFLDGDGDGMNDLSVLDFESLSAPFRWNNVYYPSVGAEYAVTEHGFVRFGLSVGRAATPESTLSPFSPPPGLQYSVSAGFGIETGNWRIDAGYQIGTGAPAVITQRNAVNCGPNAPQKSGCDGTYSLDSHSFIVSATLVR